MLPPLLMSIAVALPIPSPLAHRARLCLALPCLALPCLALPCLGLSCLVLAWLGLASLVLPSLTFPGLPLTSLTSSRLALSLPHAFPHRCCCCCCCCCCCGDQGLSRSVYVTSSLMMTQLTHKPETLEGYLLTLGAFYYEYLSALGGRVRFPVFFLFLHPLVCPSSHLTHDISHSRRQSKNRWRYKCEYKMLLTYDRDQGRYVQQQQQ